MWTRLEQLRNISMIKKIIVILAVFLLLGCAATTPAYMMPAIPTVLQESCTVPKPIPIPASNDDIDTINKLMDILVENNMHSGICYMRLQAWQDWYRLNKEAIDAENAKRFAY